MGAIKRNPPRARRRASAFTVLAEPAGQAEDTPFPFQRLDLVVSRLAVRWIARRADVPDHVAAVVAEASGLGVRS